MMGIQPSKVMKKAVPIVLALISAVQCGLAQNSPVQFHSYSGSGSSGLGISMHGGGTSSDSKKLADASFMSITGRGLIDIKRANPFLAGTKADIGKPVTLDGKAYIVKDVKFDGIYVQSYLLAEDGTRPAQPTLPNTAQATGSSPVPSSAAPAVASTDEATGGGMKRVSSVEPQATPSVNEAMEYKEIPAAVQSSTRKSAKSKKTRPTEIAQTPGQEASSSPQPSSTGTNERLSSLAANPTTANASTVTTATATTASADSTSKDLFSETPKESSSSAHPSGGVRIAALPSMSSPSYPSAALDTPISATKPSSPSHVNIEGMALIELKRNNSFLKGTIEDNGKTVTYNGSSYVVRELRFEGAYVNKYLLVDSASATDSGHSSPPAATSISKASPSNIEKARPAATATGIATKPAAIAKTSKNTVAKSASPIKDTAVAATSPALGTTITGSSSSYNPPATGRASIFDSVHGGGYSNYSSVSTQPTQVIASTAQAVSPVTQPATPEVATYEAATPVATTSTSSSNTSAEGESSKSLDKPERTVRTPSPSSAAIARVGLGILRAMAGGGSMGSIASGLQAAVTPPPQAAPQVVMVPVAMPQSAMPVQPAMNAQANTAPVAQPSFQQRPVPSNIINTPVRDKWAVIVGISRFKDSTIPTLKYPAKDAKDFYDFLVSQGNFKPDHVRLLLNEDGTRERIMTEVGDFLPRVVKPDDLVVFYFSSHGSPASKDVGNKNFLIAHDTKKDKLFAGGIDVQFIMELMNSRIKANRLLILLDACHSAGAVGAKDTENGSNFNTEQIRLGAGQLLLCSSAADERSWESKRYPNGVFTHYLIQGLGSKGPRTKIGDAFSFLQKNVSDEVQQDENVSQTPRLKTDLWKGSDLILQVPPANPEPLPEAIKKILEPDSKGKPI